MTVYQTAAGVKIGLLYTRPMPHMDRDSRLLQSALLEPRTRKPRPFHMRLLGKVWAWL